MEEFLGSNLVKYQEVEAPAEEAAQDPPAEGEAPAEVEQKDEDLSKHY